MKTLYPWQQTQWQKICWQRQQKRLHHALLLYGSSGLGKREFAAILAQAMLCLSPNQQQQACGACRSCQLFMVNHHPDYFWLTTADKSKTIKIDQMRHLIAALNQSSQLGGYQIAVIYPLEAMNRAAANALLKTLEAPAGNVQFLLISDNQANIPITILSRCQKMHFTAKQDPATLNWLQEKIASSKQAKCLLSAADMAPLRAVQLAEMNYFSSRDQLLQQLLSISERALHPQEVAALYLKQDIALFFLLLTHLLVDISRLQLQANHIYITNDDRVKPLMALSQRVEKLALQNYLLQLNQTRQLACGAIAVNLQLLLENIFLEWLKISAC